MPLPRILSTMVQVVLTSHLYAFFPALQDRDIRVEGATVAEVLRELEKLAPGFTFYICDEHGRLRKHVNIFVEQKRVSDPTHLSDAVGPDTRVFILQALSGG